VSESDPLETLREQIRAATDAAERLVREAGAQREATAPQAAPPPADGSIPPAGWEESAAGDVTSELEALAQLVQTLRELLPAELQEQLTELLRQLLIILRSLIDWAVTRIEHEDRGRELDVEDIPID
jgi:hypothetical protein